MSIYFSVDSPKIQKRKINRGEDAPVVNKEGIMIVCDGTGATGQTEHSIGGETYTSAYLGSRKTSKIAESFLSENYNRIIDSFGSFNDIEKIVSELGIAIRNGLDEFAHQNELTLTVHGKSFKLLPTTFTAVIYKAYETKTLALVLCAGDSRALWWNKDGLHQLTLEDGGSKDISVGDCNVNNCVSANGDFNICFACHTLDSKGVLLATSDGFTDPIKPFEQERFLIEWLGNFEGVSKENSKLLSQEISRKLDDIGFTSRDDCSIAGAIIGYSCEKELKDEFLKRYADVLIPNYLKPYKMLNQRYNEAEIEFSDAKSALLKREGQLVEIVKSGINDYLCEDFDISALHNERLFQILISLDAVASEIQKENSLFENEQKENRDLCSNKEAKLRSDYLEFLKTLCKEYGSVRFSDELISTVKTFYETKDILTECSQNIKRELEFLSSFTDNDSEILDAKFLNELEKANQRLSDNITLSKDNHQTYKESKEATQEYFSYQNIEVEEFFREDLSDNFFILKKISKIPLITSKKQAELKSVCKSLIELHEEIEEIKPKTTDRYIQTKKNTAFRRTVKRFSASIARELFYKDKYQVFLPNGEVNIPELEQYKLAKKQIEDLIRERTELLNKYNIQYEKYLLNTREKGKILFKNEGAR